MVSYVDPGDLATGHEPPSRQAQKTDGTTGYDIDFSDIPPLTDETYFGKRRSGGGFTNPQNARSPRVDTDVLEWLKSQEQVTSLASMPSCAGIAGLEAQRIGR